jgi:rhodanese-related sulfurtransferase
MESLIEFLKDNLLLSGLWVGVLVAWLAWEVARLGRKWQEVDTRSAVQFINQEDPLILDVSSSSDYNQGHIAGALNLPPSRIESANQQLLKQVERPVLLYCKTNRLVKLGFSQVKMLSGGLAQWINDKQPVSRDKGKSRK